MTGCLIPACSRQHIEALN
jgi:hypothetical protein